MAPKNSIEKLVADASHWTRDSRKSLLDVAAVFDSNRELLDQLSRAKFSRAQSRQFPEIAKAASITKKALRASKHVSGQMAKKNRTGTKKKMSLWHMEADKNYEHESKPGQAPTTKRVQVEGSYASRKYLATHLPDLTPEYGKVVRELTKSAATRSQLESQVGISRITLNAILKTLEAKRMIKFRPSKEGLVVRLAPHR
ncbi:MAG: hypothetical protein ACJ71Q_17895 [Terriglobales bacterium]